MPKRVFIVHRWDGAPHEDWYSWLKGELKKEGFVVEVPVMPNPAEPQIDLWVDFLRNNVGDVDADTYFVGHSIGCRTIFRYLEILPDNAKVGGVVLVAPWVELNPAVIEEEGVGHIAKPWVETPINWNRILLRTNRFAAIFSDNDPYVLKDQWKLFRDKLKAKIIVAHEKGHFTKDNVTKLSIVLEELLAIAGKKKISRAAVHKTAGRAKKRKARKSVKKRVHRARKTAGKKTHRTKHVKARKIKKGKTKSAKKRKKK